MQVSFHERYRYPILIAFACLVPLVAWGAFQALATNANDVRAWLPRGLPEVDDYAEFSRQFGSEEFLAISWDGCTLDDPRVPRLARRLRRYSKNVVSKEAGATAKAEAGGDSAPEAETPSELETAAEVDVEVDVEIADELVSEESDDDFAFDSQDAQPQGAALVESVVTGPKVLRELTSSSFGLSKEKAVARMRGFMVGPDGMQTCVLVRPTERGKQDPLALVTVAREQAARAGASPESLRMGGPLVTSLSIDQAAAGSLSIPLPISLAAAFIFSWFCFRDLRLTASVIAIGAFGGAAAVAIVWFSGGKMNAVLLSMPPLVYVATTSGAIHFANYYRDTVSEGGGAGAASRAAKHARLPLTLATITTAIGLLTLYASELLPIRDFGAYSAAGVAASMVWLLIVLPAIYAAWPPRGIRSQANPDDTAGGHDETNSSSGGAQRGSTWWAWGERVVRAKFLVTAVGLLLVTLCGLGLARVRTSVSAEEFFSEDAEFPRTSRWLEEHLGGMVPLEIVVRFPGGCRFELLERMALIGRVQRSVASLEQVSASVSALTFSPPIPRKSGREGDLRRAVYTRQFERNRGQIEEAGFLARDAGDELWRVSLRARSFRNVDQRTFIDEVRAQVEPVLESRRGQSDEPITASFTGMVPLIERSQHSLLEGLAWGLTTDVILIVVTMVILTRHWAPGVAMLAACLPPTLVVLGLFGWLGVALDIGAVLAPSVALGVSVDDVLHFLLWFRRGLEQGLDVRGSIRRAYRGCARAMFQSWGVIGLGLGIFALSDFGPTRRFGLLMLLLVSVSLVANVVLLPALLAGPLGGYYAKSIRRRVRVGGEKADSGG